MENNTAIDLNIDKFKPREAELKAKAEKYKSLRINGIEDKAGFKTVHDARMEIRNDRLEVDKFFDAINDWHNLKKKEAKTKYEEIVAPLKATEQILEYEEKRITEEKERIKREEEEKKRKEAEEKLQKRVDILTGFNYKIDLFLLKNMSDAEFESLSADAKKKFEEDEIIRKENEEKDRLAKIKADADAKELEELRLKNKELEEQKQKESEKNAQETTQQIPPADMDAIPKDSVKTVFVPKKQALKQTFSELLQNKHSEDYRGSDDDMPDDFEKWASSICDVHLMDLFESYIKSDISDSITIKKYIDFIKSLI